MSADHTHAASPPVCHLQAAAGRAEACPEAECPFWDDQTCAIAPLRSDYELDPDLTQLLLALRAWLSAGPSKRWPPPHRLTTEN